MTGKACKDCGRIMPWGCFVARKRDENGGMLAPLSYCIDCQRTRNAAYQERRREMIRTYPLLRERVLATHRAYYRRRKVKDPEGLRRNWTASNRRAAEKRRADKHVLLPIGPFRDWLQDQQGRVETTTLLAEMTGMNERRIREALGGQQRRVSLTVVDRALCNAGLHLSALYPELYQVLAA